MDRGEQRRRPRGIGDDLGAMGSQAEFVSEQRLRRGCAEADDQARPDNL